MNKFARYVLRVVLVILLLGSVLAQALLPVFAAQEAKIFPELAYLAVPYSAAAILFIGCGQLALLVVWRLLSFVDAGVIFSRRALRWVDVLAGCGAVAAALSATVMVHMLVFVGAGGPIFLWLAACIAGGLAFALLMIVMRGLLESAIADRRELDEVI